MAKYTHDSRICLFCGEKEHQHYDDCSPYWHCDCADSKKNEEIDEAIRRLEYSRPRPKYELRQAYEIFEKHEF
jgi:hypothetical protein